MRIIALLIIGIIAMTANPQPSAAEHKDVVILSSVDGFQPTLARVEEAIKKRGITVFAKIDHQAGAKSIDAELQPSVLFVIGNPKVGTPVMQKKIMAALDLPLRLAVVQDGGKVYVLYHEPQTIAGTWHMDPAPPQLAKAEQVLNAIASEGAGRN